MVIWTFSPKTETTPAISHVGRRSWRWRVHVWRTKCAIGFGAYQEVKFLDTAADWRPITNGGDISLSCQWGWSQDHYWYDGYNCTYHYGFLRAFINFRHCNKCLPDDGICSI